MAKKRKSETPPAASPHLGGSSDSFTLNFSRPATGVYVQFYKFLRLGTTGYRRVCDNAPTCAKINDATSARRPAWR